MQQQTYTVSRVVVELTLFGTMKYRPTSFHITFHPLRIEGVVLNIPTVINADIVSRASIMYRLLTAALARSPCIHPEAVASFSRK